MEKNVRTTGGASRPGGCHVTTHSVAKLAALVISPSAGIRLYFRKAYPLFLFINIKED